MSKSSTELKIDSTELKIDSNTESFQRVCALILHSAQEAGIDKMLTDPHFIPTTESAIPESATPENSRKYELMLKKYQQQRKAISDHSGLLAVQRSILFLFQYPRYVLSI